MPAGQLIARVTTLGLLTAATLGLALLAAPTNAFAAAESEGQSLYETRCAQCHDGGQERAPVRQVLAMLGPGAITKSLTAGTMQFAAEGLTADDLASLALFLTGRLPNSGQPSAEGACATNPPFRDPSKGPRWSGWGVDPQNTRFQPAPMAGLAPADIPKLTLRWAVGLRGVQTAGGQPAVGGGRLFLGTRAARVLSLDAKTGCRYWTFSARAPVRSAITFTKIEEQQAILFGDQNGNLYAVAAQSGEQIWRTKIEEHPAALITGAPVVYEGRVFAGLSSSEEVAGGRPDYACCTFRGSVAAVDLRTGERLWKRFMIDEPAAPTGKTRIGTERRGPSGAGVWTTPTIDAELGRIYVTTGDNYSDPPTGRSDSMVALDIESGKILWAQQFTKNDAYNIACNPGADNTNCPESRGPDVDFGSSPILVDLGNGKRVLFAGQKSGWFHVVDPDADGEIVWQARPGTGGVLGGIQWGSATDGQRAYVAVSDLGFRTLRKEQGNPSRGVNPQAGGGIVAYDLASGKPLWFAPPSACDGKRPGCSPGHSAAVTAIPGVVFAGSLDGHLRAYDAATGKRVWDVDTATRHDTINGVEANGGSLNGPGPVIVDGYVYVLSGYGLFGTMPGNALLAYSVE